MPSAEVRTSPVGGWDVVSDGRLVAHYEYEADARRALEQRSGPAAARPDAGRRLPGHREPSADAKEAEAVRARVDDPLAARDREPGEAPRRPFDEA